MHKFLLISSLGFLSLLTTGCGQSDPQPDKVEQRPLSPDEDPNKKGHLMNLLNHDQKEQLALAINLSGNLCAHVVGAIPLGKQLLVECTEYRNRTPSSYARYLVSNFQEENEGDISIQKVEDLRAKGWYDLKGKKYVDAQAH